MSALEVGESVDGIMEIVSELAQDSNVKIAVQESAKGGLLAGAFTAIGGLILGPLGLAAGGIIGGISAYKMSQGKFEAVPVVLSRMERSKKIELARRVQLAVQKIDHQILLQVATAALLAPNIKEVMLKELLNYLSADMRMNVIC